MPPASRDELLSALERLAYKYRALARLRARREELAAAGAVAFGGEEGRERLAELRRLAREFPAALRELERATTAQLEARARAVEEELAALRRDPARQAPGPLWMRVVLDFHVRLREALALKLWLARRLPRGGPPEAITLELVAAYRAFAGLPEDAAVEPAWLHRHLHPPEGRITSLVWEALTEKYRLPRETLERLVFGYPPAS